MQARSYEVTGDSGFLALIDPESYQSFVDRKWTLDQLLQHFKDEMRHRRLVIWGTGREDVWRIEVRLRRSADWGFREFSAPIAASAGLLLLTNYESLTMAAQFDDVSLPEDHQRDLLIPVVPGIHCCRIVQRFDPEATDSPLRADNADFLIELTPVENGHEAADILSAIPWMQL